MGPHQFIDSNPKGFDSNCSICEGKHRDAIHNEHPMNTPPGGVDSPTPVWSNQGSRFLNPAMTAKQTKEPIMAKAKSASLAAATAALTAATASNEVTTTADGYTDTLNPSPVKEKTVQELKTEAAQAKIAAKAEKQAAAAAAKAEKEAAKAAKSTETEAQKAEKKAAREARLAELKAEGRKYVGSMLALADRVKSGTYVKGPTGQLHSGDDLATVLAGVQPLGVIQLAKVVLNLENNPYSHLNVGQQSMNLRNKLRGAIRKDATVMQKVKDTIVELDLDATDAILKAKAEKAERIAKAKEDKAAKAAAKPAKQEEGAEATV